MSTQETVGHIHKEQNMAANSFFFFSCNVRNICKGSIEMHSNEPCCCLRRVSFSATFFLSMRSVDGTDFFFFFFRPILGFLAQKPVNRSADLAPCVFVEKNTAT